MFDNSPRIIAQVAIVPQRSRPTIVVLTIADLQKFFADKYGDTFPNDDAGREDLIVLLHYVAQLGGTSAMSACAARWAPWLTVVEYTAMIAGIERKPLRWSADSLAADIGLNDETRTRLGIRTIGAIDFGKRKRTKRRKEKNTAKRKAKRAAERDLRPVSATAAKPWLDVGISRSGWYREKKAAALRRLTKMAS
jgi:hypothetical protein